MNKNFVIVVLLAGLSACGSTQKSAQQKLEQGEFQSSMELFEKVVQKDPKNQEAQEGLKRARTGVLADKLIDVRKARDAGNTEGALDQLLNVIQLETAWKVLPPAAARFTQGEETQFAWKPFVMRLEGMIKAKQPLRAEITWKKFESVFTGPKYVNGYKEIGPRIARAGKAHCGELGSAARPTQAYYLAFVSRYCGYWKAGAKIRSDSGVRTRELYSAVNWSGKIDGLPADYQNILRSNVEDGLRTSPWFDPKGKRRLPLTLSGNYHFSHSKNLVSRVKEYQENESYEVVEPVTRTREVPYTAQKTVVDPVSKVESTVPETRMRSESYTVQQAVVKHRQVPRQFPYSALFHQQAIELNGSLATELGIQKVSVSENGKGSSEGDEQTLKNDHVGLLPSKPTLIDPVSWVTTEGAKWKTVFQNKLREEWISQMCRAPSSKASPSEFAESVLKCRREPTAGTLAHVGDWYGRTFGIGQADVEGILPEGK